MELQLTGHLLIFLKSLGYRYFLSKTTPDMFGPDITGITLTPISVKPNVRSLPEGFDTYFAINQEPVQMAKGVDGTMIFVKMNIYTAADYIKKIINEVIKDNDPHG